ncbi:hypothetical protein G6F50_016393 [Rhizopus delemar]|uniref:Uncharacterized protein n=1 Tax=Rhizopus delemar TaxID=936053 RepID=A0A9P6XU86_9FUNG|nr:hypothetical protein G6F23_016007 [Rhizopus arrhizus]KAG1532016.1 hypothetical protein G6F50_016393 [Rhizopus delemar]
MHQRPGGVPLDRSQEGVSDRDGNIECAPTFPAMLGAYEFQNVRMVAGKHRHLRAPPAALKRQIGASRIVAIDCCADCGC